MPELPDVEYFTAYFNRTSLHQKIVGVECDEPVLLKQTTCSELNGHLQMNEFAKARRRGKFMITPLTKGGYSLILHFGMTGSLWYGEIKTRNEKVEKYGHLQVRFDNGRVLAWLDQRKFGRIYFVRNVVEVPLLREMGPEPFELSEKDFDKMLALREAKNVKAFLMDQRDIAGIGNAYSNEILFRAGIDPRRNIKSLEAGERKRLYREMKLTLEAAVDVKLTEKSFDESWLISHVRDMLCPKNKLHRLAKKTVAGRSAVFCPVHQKMEPTRSRSTHPQSIRLNKR